VIGLVEQTRSGIAGLDEMLSGGLPQGRTILLMGGPGSGKTTLGVQFLVKGFQDHGEKGVFLSFDETKEHLYNEMGAFGWDLATAEDERNLMFFDARAGAWKMKQEFVMDKFLPSLSKGVLEVIGAKRIVVDTLTSLILQYPDAIKRRNATVQLIDALNELGTTNLLTLELRSQGFGRSLQLEEYLAHGVIVLQTMQISKSLVKTIQIEKMRGVNHDDQPRPYKITENGIEVYPTETIF